ncbi:cytidine deaminase [Bacillus solimangrovi]|uniref:Cytidine deaminase n=1 Tax=Bacillus solimangrovi TaxID=1305675 RepID=A0A1E5LHP9_9BACI|nr:cytidine deaminase [Bacillus solimangrovi]OEH93612.1 cytidine deaminase [Bacillus solimangrovi]
MNIEQQLYQTAIELIKMRYPRGWGGAAAMCLEDGQIVTSVAPEVINDQTNLCIETGSILEAHKLNKKVTHAICVVRDDESTEFKILSPCGICQERLFYWGREVQVAVSTADNRRPVSFKSLGELQPFHWSLAYKDEDLFN